MFGKLSSCNRRVTPFNLFLILFVTVVITACEGVSTSSGVSGVNWQGTWARQSVLASGEDASSYQKAFYSPSVHYRDAEGLIYGTQFEQCMVTLTGPLSGQLPTAWDVYIRAYPGVRELFSKYGYIKNLIYPTGFPEDVVEITGSQAFTYRDRLLEPTGIEVSKVSDEFLTNSIWYVDAPGVVQNQYLGCVNIIWRRGSGGVSVDSLQIGIPLNLSNGEAGGLTAEFSFSGNGGVNLIRADNRYLSSYQILEDAAVRSGSGEEFDDNAIYTISLLSINVDSISDSVLSLSLTGDKDGVPINLKGIVYSDPLNWFKTSTPAEAPLVSDLFFDQPRNDRDGDGYDDAWDDFPDNPTERADNDNDGIGDNADTDDDNDGTRDEQDPYPRLAYFGIDTDGDGVQDQNDEDDDADGVDDNDDPFPRDPNETIDTDSDGIGDAADTDDDGDGIPDTEDLLPLDARCGSDTDSVPGKCIVEILAEADLFVQAENTLYVAQSGYNGLFPLQLDSPELKKAPIALETFSTSDTTLTALLYSQEQQRLYAGFSSGVITAVDIATGESEYLLTLPGKVDAFAEAGDFILAQPRSSSTLYVINDSGEIVYSDRSALISVDNHWNPSTNQLLFIRNGSHRVFSLPVDPLTGRFDDYAFTNEPPSDFRTDSLVTSPDGAKVLSTSGYFYSLPAVEVEGRGLNLQAAALLWRGPAGLLALVQGEGSSQVYRYDDSFTIIDLVNYPGEALRLYYHNSTYYVVTRDASGIKVQPYSPNADSDNDFVLNPDDAFPIDPAASVDTDQDGSPDLWNTGYSEADSNTQLVLDAYPDDPACFRPSHGDGVNCDYATVIPTRLADKYVTNYSGLVYILFKDENRIFRWDMASQKYLTPLYIGDANPVAPVQPDNMIYSENHGRLYLGYPNGQVTSVLSQGNNTLETVIIEAPGKVTTMGAAGNYLLISHGYRNDDYKYYNAQGVVTDIRNSSARGNNYLWSESNNRLYYIRTDVTSYNLYYDELTSNGEFIRYQNAPYEINNLVSDPLIITPDGTTLFSGTGNYFDVNSLEQLGSVNRKFKHAVFLPDDRLAVLIVEEDTPLLAVYTSNFSLQLNPVVLSGKPVGLYYSDGALHVFTHTDVAGTTITTVSDF